MPSITSHPASLTVDAGATATLAVAADGSAPLGYQWRKNGLPIDGATASTYATPATTVADNGALFTVAVSNAAGTVVSNPATLTVTSPVAPSIVTPPVSQSVVAPQPATFSVVATGSAPLVYQWSRNGAAIAGANAASYTTPATGIAADSGAVFAVTITNSAGTATSDNATLTVTSAPVSVTITTQPQNKTVNAGQTATFAVFVSGTGPFSHQWSRSGAPIAGATAASYTTPATIAGDDGASFRVVVSNAAGSVTSGAATLTVTSALITPEITAQPVSVSAAAGQVASFGVTATGSAPLAYQWRKNGVDIAGATGANYTTPATVAGDNGATLSVVVSNGTLPDATSSNAVLSVNAVWTGIRQDGAPFPAGVANDGAKAVATDAQGNVFIGGYTTGVFIAGNDPGAYKPFIAKYSAAGTLLWTRLVLDAYNGFGVAEYVSGVGVDPAGNVYLTGQTLTTLAGELAAGGTDVFVAKFDTNGTRLWAHQFGSSRNDTPTGIAVDTAGTAFVVGHSDGQLPLQPPPNGMDLFIARFDTDGHRVALQQIDLGRSDEAHAVALDAQGNVYVAGSTYQQAGAFAGTKAFVAKYSQGLAQQWVTLIGEVTFPVVSADSVAVSADGSAIYVSGRTYLDFDSAGQPPVAPNCCVQGDAFVGRFDAGGSRQWIHNLSSQTLSGPRYFDDEAFGVATDAAGSAVFIAGYTAGVMPGETSKGAEDAFAARYEADGTRTWVRQLGSGLPATRGGAQNDRAFGITLDLHGDLFITGVTHGTFGTPGRNTDRDDWFLLKMKPVDGSLY